MAAQAAAALGACASLPAVPPAASGGATAPSIQPFHPANYLSHHLAGIVTAAVFADAAHIVEEIVLLKTRVNGATPATASADPTE